MVCLRSAMCILSKSSASNQPVVLRVADDIERRFAVELVSFRFSAVLHRNKGLANFPQRGPE